MSDQQKPTDQQDPTSQRLPEPTQTSKQVVRLITATTIGAALLGLSALILTGTVLALILATPVLVIFSPILVPAAALLFLFTVGFLFSGGCCVAAIAALTWIYKCVARNNSPRSDQLQLDHGRMKIASPATDNAEG
ncbi:oleosin Ara h 15.0101-like [Coffea arabica]|uniref:Oleosin n=1 Tax=Coffea arabica TaxID=13443 RepID=A0ABM4VCH2_COFAR|nr:oleosin 1-like [Coffea arabica]